MKSATVTIRTEAEVRGATTAGQRRRFSRQHPDGSTVGLTVALTLVLLCLGTLETQAAEGTRHNDELTIGVTQYPATLHPNIESMLAKVYVLGMVRRPLTVFDHHWNAACMLCTELPTLDNGNAHLEPLPIHARKDGRTQGIAVTYSIHPKAAWGDGHPITTEDVIFTWKVGLDPKSGIAGQELYRRILSIERISDTRFTVHMDRVTFDYSSLALQLLPHHLERAVFEQGAAEYRNRTLFETKPTHPGLHYGPYRIAKVSRGSHIVLERNPRWWGAEAKYRRITIRVIEKTAALEANLLSGSIDYIAGELGLALDQAIAFEKRYPTRYQVIYKPGLIYEHIDFNLENPILRERTVRQALLYGIDRSAISEQLFAGKQPVADTNVSPLDWVYEPHVTRYAYDPEKAKTLLNRAGWNQLKRGIRYNAKGEKLSLELMTTAGNRTRELVEQVLQSQWRQIGVEIRIRNEPARVFFGETISKRKFSGLAMYAWISSPESVPRSTLHSSEIPSAANGWSGQNATGYRNPEVDQLIDSIEVELDRDKRKAMWSTLQGIYADDLPVMPLYFRANAFVLPRWLTGVQPTGHQFPSTLWVESWRNSVR